MSKGSVEQLPSGSFRAVVRAGKDPITGKPLKLTETCSTSDDAWDACRRLLAQVEADSHPNRSATVSTLMTAWMEVADHELTTRDNTAALIRRVIEPKLGDMPLRKLQYRVDILDRLYKHLARCSIACDGSPRIDHKTPKPHDCTKRRCGLHVCRPLAASSIHRIHNVLSPALAYAVSWNWIERNPAAYAHPPKLRRRRARPPEAGQVARLLNLAFETSLELGLFLWLAVTTGARRGELAGLRWSRINLTTGVVVIEQSYVVRGGQHQEKNTKTDTDRRLSLDGLTVQMLTDYRAQREALLAEAKLDMEKTAFVFSPDPVGRRPWNPDHYSHAYRELADVVDIEQPLKNLRHFNATQLLAGGVDLRTTAGRLGHGDGGATTLKVYASWLPASDRNAVEQLAGDLAKLRDVHAEAEPPHASPAKLGSSGEAWEAIRPAPALGTLLEPAADGHTTYDVVAQALREAIAAGKLRSGDLVPILEEVANWYGIARSTAQRAVAVLAAEELLVRPGRRWVVA